MKSRSHDVMGRMMVLASNDEGASAVEYGLLASLIAAVIIGVLTTMGNKLSNTFTIVSNALK